MKFPILGWQCFPRTAKTRITTLRNVLSSCRSGESNRLLNVLCYCGHLWLPARGWRSVPISIDTMHFGHRTWRVQAESDLKASSLRLVFTVKDGNMQVSKGGKQLIAPSSHGAYEPQQHSTAPYPYGTVVAGISWLTSISLIGLKSHSTERNHTWFWKQITSQRLVRSWIIEETLQPLLH